MSERVPLTVEDLEPALAPALGKLSLQSGDLIIAWNLPGGYFELNRFREMLLKHLPLTVHVPGVVALYDDMDIEAVNVKAGDVLIVKGSLGAAEFHAFKLKMMQAVPGLLDVVNLPPDVEFEVKQGEPGIIKS